MDHVAGMSRQSSESPFYQPPTPVIKTNHRTPGHSSNEDFPSNNFEPETSNTRPMAMKPETQSKNLADSGSTVRIVGRGGSGSRLRVVTPTPESLELNPPLHREPPASLSRSYHGAGGSRSAQKPVGPAPALLSILRRRKQGPSSKGKEREYAHSPPLSPNLSYQASNGSGSTVSTIQFVCDPGVPRPAPVPLAESIEHSSSDKISLPLSSSTSTFDSTVEHASLDTRMSSIEDFDLDLYLEDTLSPPPEERRKKSLNKLARTLGDLPPPNAPRDIFPDEQPGKQESIPRHFIEEDPTKKDPPKVLRRASLALSTVSSVFGRPSGRRRRGSIKSYHSLSTLTDDLHQLNLADDFSDSSSACNSPGSPILFSPPSPNAVHPPNPTTPNPFGVEVEQDFLSVSSPSLSRSHSYSHGPRRRSDWLSNHSHSASTSLSYIDPSTISSSPAWIFPPSDAREEATFSIPSSPEEPQSWTGEWNSDIDDVIRALRALR
ncbi:hypothetical protein M413DRAFT_272277 [Hebeloma cylindrosporum]|uniref:Uncharacterized protein n=1 Tax=Hebeloma cylindrosporum TaxID=76867 RepID=A0A0C3CEU2_HEBCY|nr:hypothetical protein M413DRAFT_272277 [Hebeloma cylindrosporum h7]